MPLITDHTLLHNDHRFQLANSYQAHMGRAIKTHKKASRLLAFFLIANIRAGLIREIS